MPYDIRIAQLAVYPFKGMRGVSLQSAEVGPAGLGFTVPCGARLSQPEIVWDRQFMLVDQDGNMVTQRQVPLLSTLVPVFHDGRITFRRYGSHEPIASTTNVVDGEVFEATIHKKPVRALPLDGSANPGLSEFLDRPVKVVRSELHTKRRSNARYSSIGEGSPMYFADGTPLHVVSWSSLAVLNSYRSHLDPESAPVGPDRFRPNVVVNGAPPFDEDTWERFKLGQVECENIKPCDRCPVPDVDQDSGEPLSDVTKALIAIRSGHMRSFEDVKGRFFGQGATVDFVFRRSISVGQSVDVVSRLDEPNVELKPKSAEQLGLALTLARHYFR